MDKKGQLEVEVIRARGLTPKPGSKSLPGKSALILRLRVLVWRPTLNFLQHPEEWCFFTFTVLLIWSTCLVSTAPYVKVYLLDNGACKAKKKTKIARKTLDPLYQQSLLFEESPQGKVLQVRNNVWFYQSLITWFLVYVKVWNRVSFVLPDR